MKAKNSPSLKGWTAEQDGVVSNLQKTTSPAKAGTPQVEENLQTTTNLESQIDELVFELYGLSEEEKSVVVGVN